jgi:hypothetical protein
MCVKLWWWPPTLRAQLPLSRLVTELNYSDRTVTGGNRVNQLRRYMAAVSRQPNRTQPPTLSTASPDGVAGSACSPPVPWLATPSRPAWTPDLGSLHVRLTPRAHAQSLLPTWRSYRATTMGGPRAGARSCCDSTCLAATCRGRWRGSSAQASESTIVRTCRASRMPTFGGPWTLWRPAQCARKSWVRREMPEAEAPPSASCCSARNATASPSS